VSESVVSADGSTRVTNAGDRWMVQTQRRSSARLLATKRYNSLQRTILQERAIGLLLSGQRDQQVADELGIHRVTVTRWRLYDPWFQATLNHRRRLLVESTQDKLRTLYDAVLDALLDGLLPNVENRTEVALDLSHHGALNRISLGSSGETDPDAIIDREDEARERREQKLLIAIGISPSFADSLAAHREATIDDLDRKANEPPPKDATT
jgi:hypothetical protein